jgi:hypothetical protein
MAKASVPIRVTASGLVSRSPCTITGLLYLCTTAPKYVKLLDGIDANAKVVATIQCAAGVSFGAIGGAAVYFQTGLYAVFESTDAELTVFIETKLESEIEV